MPKFQYTGDINVVAPNNEKLFHVARVVTVDVRLSIESDKFKAYLFSPLYLGPNFIWK